MIIAIIYLIAVEFITKFRIKDFSWKHCFAMIITFIALFDLTIIIT